MTSGHSVDLVVGVAGSGKSTARRSAGRLRSGWLPRHRGAMSGQAAKALAEGAGILSRTVTSLNWRLEHGQEALGPRHVLVLDEGAMSSADHVAKLLGAVEGVGGQARGRGPPPESAWSAPAALSKPWPLRHPGHVWALGDNLRNATRPSACSGAPPSRQRGQRRRLVRRARPGAPCSLAGGGRVRDGGGVGQRCGRGPRRLMLAYHRDAVEALYEAARELWDEMGKLSGP